MEPSPKRLSEQQWVPSRLQRFIKTATTIVHNACQVLVWHIGSTLVLTNEVNLCRARLLLGWVSASRFDSQRWHFISVCNSATQVNSALYAPWDGKMTTSQRAVMLCGRGVKAGMACLQVKLFVAISERFTKCNWYLEAFYNVHVYFIFTLHTYIHTHKHFLQNLTARLRVRWDFCTFFLNKTVVVVVCVLLFLNKVSLLVLRFVGWSFTSLFSTNMATSETSFMVRFFFFFVH